MSGNFETQIGIPNPWSNTLERDSAFVKGLILLIVFAVCSLLLLISIVRTIRTKPGKIPEDKEWDMQSDSSAVDQSSEDENSQTDIREEKLKE